MRPRIYDLYCKAGGASMGYHRAGFEVVGVDIEPQPHYPFEFIQMDALEFLERYLAGEYPEAAAFAASPPCQFATEATKQWRAAGKQYPNLIASTRDLLKQTGKPYVIENVPGAAEWLENPTALNGGRFGMNIHRVRLFETSFPMPLALLPPMKRPVKMGRRVRAGDVLQPVGHFSGVEYARQQMGCEWMDQGELAEAIPPAYTEFIGRQMMMTMPMPGHGYNGQA